eukprot:Hpha_TRINITY_DN13903_c0_g1::TRINITY_DN13903_c0_g1_i1::g.35949::m.35949
MLGNSVPPRIFYPEALPVCGVTYKLYGVIFFRRGNEKRGPAGGWKSAHYKTAARKSGGQWHYYNDSRCKKLNRDLHDPKLERRVVGLLYQAPSGGAARQSPDEPQTPARQEEAAIATPPVERAERQAKRKRSSQAAAAPSAKKQREREQKKCLACGEELRPEEKRNAPGCPQCGENPRLSREKAAMLDGESG